MIIDWKEPKKELPPQGKKILYLKKGDVFIVQRFGKYWLPIPFYDSKFSFHDEPELWADIQLPSLYTGLVRVIINEIMYDLDSLEQHYPVIYKELVDNQLKLWGITNDN